MGNARLQTVLATCSSDNRFPFRKRVQTRGFHDRLRIVPFLEGARTSGNGSESVNPFRFPTWFALTVRPCSTYSFRVQYDLDCGCGIYRSYPYSSSRNTCSPVSLHPSTNPTAAAISLTTHQVPGTAVFWVSNSRLPK